MPTLPKEKTSVSKKIRDSARGECCQMRTPGYCLFSPETVILAHRNGGGMGIKTPDYQGAYLCKNCHDVLDNVIHTEYSLEKIAIAYFEAVFRTQEILRRKKLILIQGEKLHGR